MAYYRGSQPVVRVPPVVREDVPGGTRKVRNFDFELKKLLFYANIEEKPKVTDIIGCTIVFSLYSHPYLLCSCLVSI
jgi:hypothetical protein